MHTAKRLGYSFVIFETSSVFWRSLISELLFAEKEYHKLRLFTMDRIGISHQGRLTTIRVLCRPPEKSERTVRVSFFFWTKSDAFQPGKFGRFQKPFLLVFSLWRAEKPGKYQNETVLIRVLYLLDIHLFRFKTFLRKRGFIQKPPSFFTGGLSL